MSARQRLTFAAIAALIAVVAVVLIASGGKSSDDGAQRTAGTDAVAEEATPSPAATQEPETSQEPEATREPRPEVPEVVVRSGKPVGGVEELEFTEGDRIRFRIVSDVADHVHVHGFDLMKDVSAGVQATFSFEATLTGIFEAELEDRGEPVVSLRITPK